MRQCNKVLLADCPNKARQGCTGVSLTIALLLTLFASTFTATRVEARVFKCTNRLGEITYSNSLHIRGQRCKQIASNVAYYHGSGKSKARKRTKRVRKYAAVTPASFPRVSASKQRSRDIIRRQLLERELAKEEGDLGKANLELEAEKRADKPNLERIRSLQKSVLQFYRNVRSINLELAKLR